MNRGVLGTVEGLARIARPSGAFAMVAMDQRESLRAMLAQALGHEPTLELRVQFKVAVARILSPYASALLIDVEEGLDPIMSAGALAPGCGLIVAADRLIQPVGGLVEDTRFDRAIDLASARGVGAAAAKLLVIWRSDEPPDQRAATVREFLDAAHANGLAAIVEGVVRPPRGIAESDWPARDAAIVAAARELGALGPDLYKAQVPFGDRRGNEAVVASCREITEALECPWVVLSSGVAIEDFPRAVELACLGGASGFLAGRAIWRDALVPDFETALRERSVPRLQMLSRRVDEIARPWGGTS